MEVGEFRETLDAHKRYEETLGRSVAFYRRWANTFAVLMLLAFIVGTIIGRAS